MYCIAILTDQEQEGQNCAEYIRNYCTEKKVFPLIEIYQDQERFLGRTRKTVPAVVFLALPGVSGLNAAEHLRSLYPKCGIIWCSDLDFSLHAFRLRIEYLDKNALVREEMIMRMQNKIDGKGAERIAKEIIKL